MKSKHRKMSLLLSLSMLMGVSPTTVFAEDFTSEETLTENASDYFATNEEIGRPLPDELPVVDEEDAIAPMSENLAANYPGSGTKEDPKVYVIDSPEVF